MERVMRDNYFLLKDNCDNKTVYGVLVTDAIITKEQIQAEIYEIKNKMSDELAESYTIEHDIIPYLSFGADLEEIEEVYI